MRIIPNWIAAFKVVVVMVVMGSSGGCDCGTASSNDAGPSGDAGVPSIASSRAKLRFKEGRRLENDLAQVLALKPSEVCRELGQYSCVGDIHTVSLLGVEPYGLGFYEPLKETAVTTPIAVDRVVVSACSTRVDRDFDNPSSAVIFVDLPMSGGELQSISDPAVANAIDTLYKRGLARRATAEEINHLSELYSDMVALGGDDPARSWAKGVCFAVLTTVESLFY